jgi:hypothetical protein
VKVPELPEHDSVEVPDVPSATLVGDSVQVSPVDGETAEVRATVPVNPWSELMVTVEVPETPARKVTVVELAETVKSCTTNETATE